jgi:hypothetical protein
LRCQHHEQIRHRVRLSGHGNLPLLHRFEQCRLHLGRRAVDFVSQDQIAEDGALLESKNILAFILEQHFATSDIGWKQVGRELDAAHFCREIFRKSFYRAGLGETGQAFQQYMAVGEQADQHFLDGACLALDRGFHAPSQFFDGFVRIHWNSGGTEKDGSHRTMAAMRGLSIGSSSWLRSPRRPASVLGRC